MKLIIDIPDNDYKNIKEYYEKNDIVEATYSYIYYGTPLPKGHGRLIDADAMINAFVYTATGYDAYDLEEMLEEMPTIIEADKGDKE